jgi:transposase-like protein
MRSGRPTSGLPSRPSPARSAAAVRKAVAPGPQCARHDARVKELEREVRELKRANEILKVASAFFAQAGDRRLK